MTRRAHSSSSDRQAWPTTLRKTPMHLMPGDVIQQGGRYRGIVHAVHHHGMCVCVELFDGTRMELQPGATLSVRA